MIIAAGNGWMKSEGVADPLEWIVRWKGARHPQFGMLQEHGPDVPPVFFLAFTYPIQTAASYAHDAEALAWTGPQRTWHARN